MTEHAESALTDEALREVLVGDLEPFRVELRAHDASWGEAAAVWIGRLRAAVPDAVAIEHVGSTSVPDLKAKPVIDLLMTVADPEAPAYEGAIEDLGLALRVRVPGRRTLRTAAHDVQLHVLQDGDPLATSVLRLRDRLRESPEARAQYEAHKEALASTEWRDMHYYSEAKSPVIRTILGDG